MQRLFLMRDSCLLIIDVTTLSFLHPCVNISCSLLRNMFLIQAEVCNRHLDEICVTTIH